MAEDSAVAAAAAAEGKTAEDRVAAEAAAREEGLKTQARLQAELEQTKREQEDEDRRRRQAAAQARRPTKTHIVALMVVAPRNVAEEFAKTIKAKLVTAEELRIMPDWETGAHRFEYVQVAETEFCEGGHGGLRESHMAYPTRCEVSLGAGQTACGHGEWAAATSTTTSSSASLATAESLPVGHADRQGRCDRQYVGSRDNIFAGGEYGRCEPSPSSAVAGMAHPGGQEVRREVRPA